MTSVVILQPNYVPWIGYFDLMSRADVWVWYDDVQYTKNDWRNRNVVLVSGRPRWLTIPVRSRHRFGQRVCDVEIAYATGWPRKHLRTVEQAYADRPYVRGALEVLSESFDRHHRLLADLTIELNEAISSRLGLGTSFVRSSALHDTGGERQERLIHICTLLGADTYLSGPAARAYIDLSHFTRHGIRVLYMTYDYPSGPLRPEGYNVSILDTLARLGDAGTRDQLGRSHLVGA